jgi:septal ring factor EnvC (AmiA/AmiB activator)
LENKLGEFMDEHERVRREREALQRQLQEQQAHLREIALQLKRYEQERTQMRARLEKILSRLEGLNLP